MGPYSPFYLISDWLSLNSVIPYCTTKIKKRLESVLLENLIYLCSSQQLKHFMDWLQSVN